ncbi:hypothetical protein AB0K40_38755 [Nonomuraea bangladeshensis]|uniref:Uncharacterized protein n=1 Tax=Nonomuraea bangladeshensis TaxID=404385 RepID=A0ABV3HG02_9ACTN
MVLLAGLVLGVVGYLGLAGRLPRNEFAGVRTATTMRSDATFLAARREGGRRLALTCPPCELPASVHRTVTIPEGRISSVLCVAAAHGPAAS